MRIVIISDTHGGHRQVEPMRGDVLIHCGDIEGGFGRERHHHLGWLLKFRRMHIGGMYDGAPSRAIFFVGDTQAFAPSETIVRLDDLPHRVLSFFVADGEVSQIADDGENEYAASVQALLRVLPEGATVVFGFGELDCRAEGALLAAVRAQDSEPASVVAPVVARYVDRIMAWAQARQQRVMFCGAPAPSEAALAAARSELKAVVIEVVRAFNEALRTACARVGARLLDIHRSTATIEGVSDGRYHIDPHHVHPETLRSLLDPVPRRIITPARSRSGSAHS